jgi:hypothetical protein
VRLNLKLPDGDTLRLRLLHGRTDLVIHLFHGLEGSADAGYMQRAAAHFREQGHTLLAMNHRGAGEGRALASRTGHLGSTADLAAVIQAGRGLFPEHLHVAVGFSSGATILLLLLGRDQGLVQPDRAIAVSPLLDLERTSLRLGRGLNRIYDRCYVRRQNRRLLDLWEIGLLPVKPPGPKPATLRELDERYTGPAAGFSGRSDYYAQCSCGPYLAHIRVPTVILAAADDPFAPGGDLEQAALPPPVHLHLEPHGGHLGFLARNVPGHRWLDLALGHYVQALSAPGLVPPLAPRRPGSDGDV